MPDISPAKRSRIIREIHANPQRLWTGSVSGRRVRIAGTALTTSAEATSALQAFHGALCKMEELMGADWRAGLPIYVEGGAITVV